jgi:hypothetical protein
MKHTLSRFELYGELKPTFGQVPFEELSDLAKSVTITKGPPPGDRSPKSKILCTGLRASRALIGQSVTTFLKILDR